jgi:2-polyprenyl-6-hydroxyphenyl methylase/3-demethylubiquinone-9 3-methyltransferase
MRILANEAPPKLAPGIFDAGCGNGVTAHWLAGLGYEVAGIDASHHGITQAKNAYPELRLEVGSVYDDLAARFGRYPVVISLEVIEHLYSPRAFTHRLSEVLEEGGVGIVSTPYHGYWKNLMLALSGKLDDHFTALWGGGHIKFWSPQTLSALLVEAGFSNIRFYRVGRIPPLAKSMIAVFRR